MGRDRGIQGGWCDSLIAEAGENNAVCNGGATMSEMAQAKWSDWTSPGGEGLDDFVEIIYEKKFHQQLGGGVARITLNKPEKLNAWDTPMRMAVKAPPHTQPVSMA